VSQHLGILIADTFRAFNLSYGLPVEQELLLRPFRHAHSLEDTHKQAIASLIHAPTVLVAEVCDQIVGVPRGSPSRCRRLCHYQMIPGPARSSQSAIPSRP
jgi:hypothetical protein